MPKPKLPKSDWSIAREAFIRLLETDPELKAAGCKFAHFSEDNPTAANLAEGDGPTLAQTPWVKIQAGGDQSQWETEGMHRAPLVMTVEIASEGRDEGRFFDLWGAVCAAIYPQEPGSARRAAADRIMSETKVQQITMISVPRPQPAEGKALIGVGAFRLDLYVSTKY